MLGCRPHAVGPAIVALGMLVGCQTARPVLPPEADVQALAPTDIDFAEGLARYAQGLIHDYEGRYDAALTNYLRAVELDASSEELSIRIAMGLLQQKRTEEAIHIMEALVRERPNSEKAIAFMALVYQAGGRTEEVQATLEKWVALAPASSTPYLQLGKFLRRHGTPEAVVALFQRGIETVDEPGPLHLELSKHYLQQAEQQPDAASQEEFRRRAWTQLKLAADYAPDNVELLREVGQQAIRLEEPIEALAWFAKIEAMRPRDLTIKHQLALDFATDDDVEHGIELLRRVIKEHPDHRQAHYYLAELALRSQDQETAVEAFQQAFDSDPEDPSAAIRLALIQIESDPPSAIQTLKRGLEHSPEEVRLLELLGHAYLAADRPHEAVDAFAQAQARAEPKAPPAQFFYHFARAAYKAGELDRAIPLLWRTLDENLAYLQLFMRESLSEAEDGEIDAVSRFLERFAETYPDEPAGHLNLGLLKNYQQQFDQALGHFDRALALAEQHHRNTQLLNQDFYFAYGAAHERTGRIDDAARWFRKALALDPKHDNAHNYLAYMWAERGIHLEEALDHVRQALAIDPDSGPYLDTLGWIYYQMERYEDALREIERAAVQTPNDPTINDHLGDVLWKLDRPQEAIERWKTSYRLDPDNDAVADKLRRQHVDLNAVLNDSGSPTSEPAPTSTLSPPDQPSPEASSEPGVDAATPLTSSGSPSDPVPETLPYPAASGLSGETNAQPQR